MEELTARQQQVLDVILTSVEETGRFPPLREIARQLRLASPATVHQHLAALETKGFLQRLRGRWTLSRRSRRDRGIPIVGRVAAGAPVTAAEEVEGHLTPEFLGARRGRFSVRVRGESMTGEGMLDGDYVVIEPEAQVKDGDLVVAYLGPEREVTVKRLRRERDGGFRLHPAHPDYPILAVPRGDPYFRIAGKVVGLWRRCD